MQIINTGCIPSLDEIVYSRDTHICILAHAKYMWRMPGCRRAVSRRLITLTINNEPDFCFRAMDYA